MPVGAVARVPAPCSTGFLSLRRLIWNALVELVASTTWVAGQALMEVTCIDTC